MVRHAAAAAAAALLVLAPVRLVAATCTVDSCGEHGHCARPGSSVANGCFCESGYQYDDATQTCIQSPGNFAYYKSLCLLGCILLIGKVLRIVVPLFQRTFMPAAIIAGLFWFFVLQLMQILSTDIHKAFTHHYTVGWSKIGPFAVDVLFASLFLGTEIPTLGRIVSKAGPQFIYNQLINWGLWVFSCLAVMLICTPIFGSDPLLATLIPAGFTGGHAIVYALAEKYHETEYKEAVDVGLFVATLGQVASFVLGVMWINMAAAQNKLSARPKVATSEDNRDAKLFAQGLFPDEQMPSAGKLTCSPDSMDVLTLHAAVVFLAMFIGIEFWQAVTPWMLANLGFEIQRFVWCMAVGIIFQVIYERLVFRQIIPAVLDSAIMSRLQGIVLDFLIVSAMSTLNVATIWDHLLPATIASVVGLAWLGFATWWLADYFLPDYHFERAICEYGQTTGVISSGLVLLKMCDPNQRLPVMESFALKNFAAMPFMFTWLPLTIPIMDGSPTTGPVTVLLISLALMFLCVVTWYFYYLPIFKRTPPAVLDDGLDPDRSSATARYSRGSVSFL